MAERDRYECVKFSNIVEEASAGASISTVTMNPEDREAPPHWSSSCSRVTIVLGAAVFVLLVVVIGMGIAMQLCPEPAPEIELRKMFCVDPNTGIEAKVCEICPDGWKKGYKESCYFISTESQSWDIANSYCSKVGAHLVGIENEEEQNFLQGVQSSSYYWIGLNCKEKDWKWRWADNNELDEKKISLSKSDPSYRCAYVYKDKIFSYTCDYKYKWICEREVVHL
ncbi:natural killer cells antigen CD94-like [Acipenser ruthenus]|uniref:natural killer cells antigen CD94-like n=1 Tax=Acipenser ruthenus TaxID=7906 RepID=UPI002741C415|nr:natural killer cells antigen CD94-like [Acipenser ruthenus]